MIRLNCMKLVEEARLPTYATSGAAALDFYCVARDPVTLYPGAAVVLHTGLAVEVPEGYVLLLFSRSGHGFKNDIRLGNCVGVIDADFRGEVLVKLACDDMATCDEAPLIIEPGDRIAQGIIFPRPRVECVEVDGLTGTTRGLFGLGSTGAMKYGAMKYGLHLWGLMMRLAAPIRSGWMLCDPKRPVMKNPRFDRERQDAAAARRAARNARRAATRR